MDFSVALKNGQVLRGIFFAPSDNPRAIIIMVHGIGEHVKRYSNWAEMFSAEGIGLIGVDLPGHGLSDGKRGHIKNYSVYREMIDTLINVSEKTYPGVPVFIYGHSLGGGIVLDYLVRREPSVRGAIVTSPWLRLVFAPSPAKLAIAGIARYLFPALTQPTGLNVNHISHDKAVVEEYEKDPLVHDKISVSLFHGALAAAGNTMANASKIKLPLLLLHGSDDMITSPEATRELAGKAQNAEIEIFEGGYHELHNEPFKKEVFDYILGWINKRL